MVAAGYASVLPERAGPAAGGAARLGAATITGAAWSGSGPGDGAR